MWKSFYNVFEPFMSGERALAHAVEQNRIERYFTFPNFEKSAHRCADVMREAGLADVEVEYFPADGSTAWSGWPAMKAWDVESARLWLNKPHRELLADWSIVPQQLVMYSGPANLRAELVEWNGEPSTDLEGKVPLTRHRLNDVMPQMRARGVVGILSDFIGTLPGVRDSFDLPDDVRWENFAFFPWAGLHWGFMISPRTGDKLRTLMRAGAVEVEVDVRTRVYDGTFNSATGLIPGSDPMAGEVLFVSHLYEPGANDNASGTAVGLELLGSLNAAIQQGVIERPRRGIRFLFGWEGFGLFAWMHKHRDRLPQIAGGINIDEIGVDQAKGRSIMHLFRPPAANPSCIGHLLEHLCEELFTPGIRWKAVADRAEIINDAITADPNIDVVLPALLQYPSSAYHSSADKPEMLDPDVMRKIGLLAGTHLCFLAGAGAAEARYLARLVAAGAQRALQKVELRLLSGSWPFGIERTRVWFAEQFSLSIASVARFSLPAAEVETARGELLSLLDGWLERWQGAFPAPSVRKAGADLMKRATQTTLCRVTLGSPFAWTGFELSAEEERRFRDILFGHNLDFLLHRICYWSNGRRTVLEIVERLEIELDELLRDATIARTASGTLIGQRESVELDLEAVFFFVDHLIKGNYLGLASIVGLKRLKKLKKDDGGNDIQIS